MSGIAIVTDSTADLELDYYERNDVRMVPLRVYFDEESFLDWREITPEQFYERLRDPNAKPRTSQPSPADFVEVYKELAKDHDTIISCHLSGKLSGTVNSAETARGMVEGVNIEIIDSKSVSMGLGIIIDSIVRDRAAGLEATEVINKTRTLCQKRKLIFVLDTLEYLQRGGRIGKASAFLGSMLNIKPMLLIDSEVLPYKRIRGKSKVIGEMLEFVRGNTSGRKLNIAIGHVNNENGAEALMSAIKNAGLELESGSIYRIGAVIGTYGGPGTLGLAFYES